MQKIEQENRTTRKTKGNKNQNNLTCKHWAWLNSVLSASASALFSISLALKIIHTQLIQKKGDEWIASERRIFSGRSGDEKYVCVRVRGLKSE